MKAYAVVNSGKWKYSNRVSLPLVDSQLPIFWKKSVAEKFIKERGLFDKFDVKKVYIGIIK